jgi:hypothetical protein
MNARLVVGACLLLAGCLGDDGARKESATSVPARPAPATKKVEVGEKKNVVLEIDGDQRRVLVHARVCLRQGQLEQFLTRKGTKEHEAILAADVDARDIHTALTLARAEPGSPVKFRPQYAPASGTVIKVFIEYDDNKGNKARVSAQQWVRSIKTQKDLAIDWVFAGSLLLADPQDPTRPPFYAANDGDVICVSNFETAMLDLPIMSTATNDDLFFEAHTDRIPPLETPVTVILEPVLQKNKK